MQKYNSKFKSSRHDDPLRQNECEASPKILRLVQNDLTAQRHITFNFLLVLLTFTFWIFTF